MNTSLYLSLLILILISCARSSNNNIDEDSIAKIDLFSEPESELTLLSDVSTGIEYIALETKEESMLASIEKIKSCNNKIYIKTGNEEILSFDNAGKFLFKLDKTGRGPEEYLSIYDFDVSSDDKTLLILSNGKILVYDISDRGVYYAKSISLKTPHPSKIDMIAGTTSILMSVTPMTGNEPALSIVINTDGDTLLYKPNCYLSENKNKYNWAMVNECLHYDYEKSICFKEEFSDTVFSFNKELNVFKPRLIFDSHGKGFSPRVRYDSEYAKIHGTELYWVYSILETQRYVIYNYEHNKIRNKTIYDKSERKKYKIALKDAFIDDINGGPNVNPNFCSEGKVFYAIEALTLKNYIKTGDFLSKQVKNSREKEELKKLAESLEESDNPVLIELTLKK